MIGNAGIASVAVCGRTISTTFPLVAGVDDIATREQQFIQPWPMLEFYEIETSSSGTLRYVDFQTSDPTNAGTLPQQIDFNGNDYSARKIERSALKSEEGVAQFQVTIEDVDRELISVVDLENGLNTEKVHLHSIPYDLVATKPFLATTETYRIRQALASIGPDTVSFSMGLPSLADYEMPARIISRNRCWEDFNRRFFRDNHCTYPSDYFERGTDQLFGSNAGFGAGTTTWPQAATKRRYGWSTINADIVASWRTGTQSPSADDTRGCQFSVTYSDMKLGPLADDTHRLQAVDSAVTQDFLVFVDVTDDLNNPATTTAAYPATPTTSDSMIFGAVHPFTRLEVDVDTAGAGGYALTWEYWNGSAYAALSGVTDDTNGFKNTGANSVTFTVPGAWAASSGLYLIRARVTTTGFTTIPLLQQAWTEQPHNCPYMWKDISGDFDLSTRVRRTVFDTQDQWMNGFLVQDPAMVSDWIFWGNAENSSNVEKMRVRQSTKAIQTDTDFDTTDGNERIRITRVGDTFTAYSRVNDTDSWVQKSVKTWTSAPLPLRVGLVVASDFYDSGGTVDSNVFFDEFVFASGGFVTCDRSETDCALRENLHQFNAFTNIPNQRTRG